MDMPHWMILKIDRIAGRKGLARQAQIKEWLADKLKEERKSRRLKFFGRTYNGKFENGKGVHPGRLFCFWPRLWFDESPVGC